jgi:hypothetical protein
MAGISPLKDGSGFFLFQGDNSGAATSREISVPFPIRVTEATYFFQDEGNADNTGAHDLKDDTVSILTAALTTATGDKGLLKTMSLDSTKQNIAAGSVLEFSSAIANTTPDHVDWTCLVTYEHTPGKN